MPRTAGRRGRLPAKPEGERYAIKYLHEYLSEPLPAPQYPVDVTGGIAPDAWGMLGNGPDPTCTIRPSGVGDCPWCGRQHYGMAKAACNGAPMPTETSNQLVTEYLTYDHGQDVGGVLADVLLAWYKAGIILGFAPVDHTDRAACDSAMQQFKGLYIGVDLTGDADDLFNDGQPWTVANGEQPDLSEGHCVLRVKASGPGPDARSGNITWGAEQASTWDWDAACTVEAWVAIMSEDEIDPAALAALRADIDALHGTGGEPAPAPAPEPVPAPPAVPGHPHDFIHELLDDAREIITKGEAWLESHLIPGEAAPSPLRPGASLPITDPDELLADIGRFAREVAAGSRTISELIAYLGSFGI